MNDQQFKKELHDEKTAWLLFKKGCTLWRTTDICKTLGCNKNLKTTSTVT